jgi:hypothetical protein
MSQHKPAAGGRPGGNLVPNTLSGPRNAAREVWVEMPAREGAPAAWCYSDRRAYRSGDEVVLYLSANVADVSIRIYRDTIEPDVVHVSAAMPATFQPVPERAYEVGCDWPEFLRWRIPADLPSGGYIVEISAVNGIDGTPSGTVIGHHFFVVRSKAPAPGTMALVLATSTWAAYNDWGGANHYYGLNTPNPRGRSPILAANRPWARGQIWLPEGAPRAVNARRPTRPGPARYETIEWAFLHGFTKYYSFAGWASHERPFLHWAEREGYAFDLLTQDDLHAEPGALDAYACTVFVGHDEYWSLDMRQAVDAYVDAGGKVARFAGNFLWQIRLEADAQRQVAYKYDARTLDPQSRLDPIPPTLTSAWEDPLVGYPGAATFGVNALRGVYAGFGGMASRAARGFNVFRPGHWSFAGTGLGYADMFGDEANIFGYEMDGLDYTFVDGLPVPTGTDGAPAGLEILAMGWATLAEAGRPEDAYSFMLGDGDARYRDTLMGDGSAESLARNSRGSGMVVHFKRGAGEVYTAGTCEWVNGLIQRDVYTETITRNVLDRFSKR